MTTILRTFSATAVALAFALPVLAQSGANRTGTGIPAPKPSNTTIVETKEVKNCRQHCGAMAATPNMKTLPTAADSAARSQRCQKKMLG